MDIKNLPTPMAVARNDLQIRGHVEDGEIVVRAGPEGDGRGVEVYRMSYHYKLKDVDPDIQRHMADQLATAIRGARDAGFRQGQAFVRQALGLTRTE